MKIKNYTIELKCNAHQFSKIQKAIRTIIPKAKTKPQRLLNKYGEQTERLINLGLTQNEIYLHLNTDRDENQEPITRQQVYRLVNDLGYSAKTVYQKTEQ